MTALARRSQLGARARADGAAQSDWLLNQLPVGMLDADFFVRFVSIFQELGGTLLEDADNIDNIADVTVAPDALVRWLGSWIGVGVDRPLAARRTAAAHRRRVLRRR